MPKTKRFKVSPKRVDEKTAEVIGKSSFTAEQLAYTYNVSLATVKRCRAKHKPKRGPYVKRTKQPTKCPRCGHKIETTACLICAARRVGDHV